MPGLDDASLVLNNYAPDLVELARAEAAVPGQNDRFDSELRLIPLTANVNVHRFSTVEAIEEQPVRPGNSGDARHDEIRLDNLIVVSWYQARLTTSIQLAGQPNSTLP
jgi:hypothetical protein